MLTQHIVRTRLDAIAADVLQMPGMYYELYSRVFSQRVRTWLESAPRAEAVLIERVAELDPDYCPHLHGDEIEYPETDTVVHRTKADNRLFNPAWDVQY